MLSAVSAGGLAARASPAWLAPAVLAWRGYATQVGKTLRYGEHGAPERVLALEQEQLPAALGDHEVLINVLAVRLSCGSAAAGWLAGWGCLSVWLYLAVCISCQWGLAAAPIFPRCSPASAVPPSSPCTCTDESCPGLSLSHCRHPSTPQTSTQSRASIPSPRSCRGCPATRAWGR